MRPINSWPRSLSLSLLSRSRFSLQVSIDSPTVRIAACTVDTTRMFHWSTSARLSFGDFGKARPVDCSSPKSSEQASAEPRIVSGPEPTFAPGGATARRRMTSSMAAELFFKDAQKREKN